MAQKQALLPSLKSRSLEKEDPAGSPLGQEEAQEALSSSLPLRATTCAKVALTYSDEGVEFRRAKGAAEGRGPPLSEANRLFCFLPFLSGEKEKGR